MLARFMLKQAVMPLPLPSLLLNASLMLAMALLLFAPKAIAQPVPDPETLDTPYEEPASDDPPPSATPSQAAARESNVAPRARIELSPPVAVGADTRPLGPIRAQRRLALMGEIGWNGIAGFGPTLTFHAHPRLSFDFGSGISLTGWKIGLRGRFNFLEGPVTPFIGLGGMSTSGLGEVAIEPAKDATGSEPALEAVTVRVQSSSFVQGVVGLDWTSRGGFTLLSSIGYAWLLNGDNLEVISGRPTYEHEQAFDAAFRSSIVLTVGTGYSFK